MCVWKDDFTGPCSYKHVHFSVLCGHNHKLYRSLLHKPNVTPYMYIQNQEELNALYDEVDGIITKPGGVTISEVLHKKIPVFIFDTLPGQEEYNLQYLVDQDLVFHIKETGDLSSLEAFLNDYNEIQQKIDNVETYLSSLTCGLSDVLLNIQKDSRQRINVHPVEKKENRDFSFKLIGVRFPSFHPEIISFLRCPFQIVKKKRRIYGININLKSNYSRTGRRSD